MMRPAESPLPTTLESRAVVRFQDCDPFGHLNNARYLDYFMNARQDQLAEFYGFTLFERGRQASENWVVTKHQIAYLLPAMLMEQVLIRTRLIHASERVLVVEGLMLDGEGQRLKAVLWAEFTYVSLATGRATRHPEELMGFFAEVQVPAIFEADGFNARVAALREQHRKRGRQPMLEPVA